MFAVIRETTYLLDAPLAEWPEFKAQACCPDRVPWNHRHSS
ncbi:MAG TPA: hypothetical protein VGG11_18555 [Xanthobacteraceae bacterium]|jgi:hypothetical protein